MSALGPEPRLHPRTLRLEHRTQHFLAWRAEAWQGHEDIEPERTDDDELEEEEPEEDDVLP